MDGVIGDNVSYSLTQAEFVKLFNYGGDDRLSYKVLLTNTNEIDTETHLGLLDDSLKCMTLQGSSDNSSTECDEARKDYWLGGSCLYMQECSYKERMIL